MAQWRAGDHRFTANLGGDGLLASPSAQELPDRLLGGVGVPPEPGHVPAVVLLQRLAERAHHLPGRLEVRLGQRLAGLGLLVGVEDGLDGAEDALLAAAPILLRPDRRRRRREAEEEEGCGVSSPGDRQPAGSAACSVARRPARES